MLSLLAILLVSNVKSQYVCISGRVNSNNINIQVNGLYSYDSDYNGYKSYKKTTDCTSLSTLYIYRVGSQWRIGESKSDTVGYIGYCTQNEVTSCTTNTWLIAESNAGFTADNAMYAQADQCPTWDCASVTIPNNAATNCQNFNTQVAPNTYKTSNNYYWHFSIEFQTWFCINGNDPDYTSYDTCQVTFSAAADQGWMSASSGDSLSLGFQFPSDTTYTVNCVGQGSNYPSPTASPTDPTPEPSAPPTVTSNVIPTGDSYCIYGRSGSNSVINGYWEPTGRQINSVNSYSKTIYGNSNSCGVVGTLYLYVLGTQWYISDTEGSSAHTARCGRDTSVNYPACDSNGWYVWANGEVQDNQVQITTEANCPQLPSTCSEIDTSLSSGCAGPFTPLSDGTPNAYKNSDGSLYFYYIPYADSWVCDSDLDGINTCPYSYSGGDTITGFDISCDGTSAPTRAPSTGQPTSVNDTPNPTDAPQASNNNNNDTPNPTRNPVSPSPTESPTIAPAFCVSGRSGDNAKINGFYKEIGERLNSYQVYAKTVSGNTCSPTLYLYRNNDFWYIGQTKGSTTSFIASCLRDVLSTKPACRSSANWNVYSSGNLLEDANVVIAESTSCTSTCTGTGTNTPTRSPTRSPQTSGNNNNTPTTSPQTSGSNNRTPSPTKSPEASGSSNTQDNTSHANIILCKFYVIVLLLLFGLIVIV